MSSVPVTVEEAREIVEVLATQDSPEARRAIGLLSRVIDPGKVMFTIELPPGTAEERASRLLRWQVNAEALEGIARTLARRDPGLRP